MTATLAELGYPDALVTELSDGFLRIRTEPIDLVPAQTPAPSPSARPPPSAGGLAHRPPRRLPPSRRRAHLRPRRHPHRDRRRASPSAEPTPPPIAEGTEFAELETELEDRFGTGDPRLVRTVGPIIGAELIRTSAILIVVGELFILAYLWMRFGFRFGTAAIIALLHDVILVVGHVRRSSATSSTSSSTRCS